MNEISATDLASALNLSKGRVSQFVSAGKLDGCFHGDGRSRRFDLDKVKVALGRSLDKGQMLGNGAKTRKAIASLDQGGSVEDAPPRRKDGVLPDRDPDRYELARTQKAEEELRRLRRQNEQDEGTLVLASEVERQVAKVLGQEIAEVETVLREGARAIADQLAVDFKSARKILVDTWRAHRKGRTERLDVSADAADLTDAERSADI